MLPTHARVDHGQAGGTSHVRDAADPVRGAQPSRQHLSSYGIAMPKGAHVIAQLAQQHAKRNLPVDEDAGQFRAAPRAYHDLPKT